MTEQKQALQIGIIGAGRGGSKILELFSESDHAQIAYIVDTNSLAPGILTAKKLDIPTFSSVDEAMAAKIRVRYIYEVTRSPQVSAQLSEAIKGTETELITHEMSFLLIAALEEKERSMYQQVTTEIYGIKAEIAKSLRNVKKMVEQLEDITADMRLLALNARIEAARIGDQGRGFGVVAQQMTNSVDHIRDTTVEIETLNSDILQVSDQIDNALDRLKFN